MPCYSQQLAIPQPGKTKTGKTPYRFIGKANSWWVREHGAPTNALHLPCRKCIGCRLEKSRQWATRLMHEIPAHNQACFLTLTYDDQNLPKNGSLDKTHLRAFFNDLRSRNSYYGKEKIKYFACGEYGDQTGRPHYHAALYGSIGCEGTDDLRTEEEPSRSGALQYSHADIAATWPHGLHRISELSFESAAYVARYVLKKMSGPTSANHYGPRIPEFQTSSNGLGKSHLIDSEGQPKWLSDVYPADHVVLPGRGAFMPPPYYDRILEKVDPGLFEKVKAARKAAHETLTSEQWLEENSERHREGEVRKLVTEQTLIRGIL